MRKALAIIALSAALFTTPFAAQARIGGPGDTPNIPQQPGPQIYLKCDLAVSDVQILLPNYQPAPANPWPTLKPGQPFHVRAKIKNMGAGPAAATKAGLLVIINSPNDPMQLVSVPALNPGQEKIVTFDVAGLPAVGSYPTHVYADYGKTLGNETATQNNHGMTALLVQ